MQVIVFNLGNEKFALETKFIHGIEKMMDVTKVPLAPKYITGLINLRGNIIIVIDLKVYLGMNYIQKEENIIVVEIDEEKIGFIVDSVHEVTEVEDDMLDSMKDNNEKILGVIKFSEYIATLLNGDMLLKKQV
jgi:purine-binding chemotaxis protein CheW